MSKRRIFRSRSYLGRQYFFVIKLYYFVAFFNYYVLIGPNRNGVVSFSLSRIFPLQVKNERWYILNGRHTGQGVK